MITQANYLDFGNIYVNEIIGDFTLAIIILNLLTLYFCLKMGVKGDMLLIILILEWCAFVAVYLGMSLLWIIVLTIVSIALTYIYYKLTNMR